jgi:hypothetical protein
MMIHRRRLPGDGISSAPVAPNTADAGTGGIRTKCSSAAGCREVPDAGWAEDRAAVRCGPDRGAGGD